MAGDEDEAEEVVADGVVESGVEVGRGLFEGFEFAGELFVFALGDGVAAEEIDGAAFGGCDEPCPGIIGDARLRHCSSAATSASCARSSAKSTQTYLKF